MATARQSRHLKKAFLDSFRQHGNISRACRDIGLSRATLYVWKEHDADFMLEYEQAEIEATEVLENAAYERAVNGVTTETPIVHRGKVVDTVVETKYSDTLLIFLLKARSPSKYRETIRNEHSGPSGLPIAVNTGLNLGTLSVEELATLESILAKTCGEETA